MGARDLGISADGTVWYVSKGEGEVYVLTDSGPERMHINLAKYSISWTTPTAMPGS
jgi:hypothetical protein